MSLRLVPGAAIVDVRRIVTLLQRHRDWYSTRALGVAAGSLVRVWRPLQRNCAFVAVTGSCGKTTAKELIAGVLGSKFRGSKSRDGFNQHYHTATALLRVRPGDRFNVQEVGVGKFGVGAIDVALDLIRPTIGVVTSIGSDHISAFRSLDAIAQEKRKLVEALPPTGTAVLNADDPLVLAMRDRCKGRVLTYGVSPEASVRADGIDATWPGRLTFTARYGDQAARVETQLCGEHWLASALAALTVGIAMGMTLAEAADGIRTVPPFPNRMFPVTRSDGVTFVFDDAKTPSWTIPAAFAFMRRARAARRIIVMGSISDYLGSSEKAFMTAAKDALRSADHVVFVGSKASKALPARRLFPATPLHAFYAIDMARDHLAKLLRESDLVLLKGIPADRLQRIYAAPRDASAPAAVSALPTAAATTGGAAWIQALVAFGNPSERYRGSPHNAGWEVVERLAGFLDAQWTVEQEAHVATVRVSGGTLHLVKPLASVNVTGPALKALGARLGFGAAECVLVHDDLNLDAGAIRARARGNDGGHNGVRSVLHAFGTIDIRRVKVGVGRPGDGTPVSEYVLTPMPPDQRERMQAAYALAVHRALTLLALPDRAHDDMMDVRNRFEQSRAGAGGLVDANDERRAAD